MKKIGLILILALLIAIPFSLWSQESSKGEPDGAELFKARCGTCHEKKGEGLASAKIPPINNTSLSAERIASIILEGKGGFRVHNTPIVNIDEAGAKAIADYIKNDLK
jgi:mono/diheme cytochrome c family protein